MDDSAYTQALPFLFLFVLCSPSLCSSQLSPSFYALSCPNVELLVRDSIRSASGADPSLLGKLLRLLFHDCIVEGCDASVLVAGNGTERSDPANLSLGGFEAVDAAKKLVDLFCPGIVSCADVLVLAARDAVAIAGGPSVEVPLGRRDGRVSLASNVRPNMVDTSFSLDEMAHLFSAKGLSMDDLVALSGAHTIGSAHCSAFSERFEEDANGNLVPIDGSIEGNYAMELIKKCPANASPATTVEDDPVTPNAFDNQYYTNLLHKKGLFLSDAILSQDSRTREMVEAFSQSREKFFASWEESFVRLTSIGVKIGSVSEIRSTCSRVNG